MMREKEVGEDETKTSKKKKKRENEKVLCMCFWGGGHIWAKTYLEGHWV